MQIVRSTEALAVRKPDSTKGLIKFVRLLAAFIERAAKDPRFSVERIAAEATYFGGRRDRMVYRDQALAIGNDDRFAAYFVLGYPITYDGVTRTLASLINDEVSDGQRAALPLSLEALTRARFVIGPVIGGSKIGSIDIISGGHRLEVRTEFLTSFRGQMYLGWLVPNGTQFVPVSGFLLHPIALVPPALVAPGAKPTDLEAAFSSPLSKVLYTGERAPSPAATIEDAVSLFDAESRNAGLTVPRRSITQWCNLVARHRPGDDVSGFLHEALRGPAGDRQRSLPIVRFSDLAHAALRIWALA